MKKEISAENIYFWTACERYRQMIDTERKLEAIRIFDKYLSHEASDPVNVDSKARSLTEKKLHLAEMDLFEKAQSQVFDLMKYDSYQRFIKSDIYYQYIKAEDKLIKVPFMSTKLDPDLQISKAPHKKLKKSRSNADDKRRKSLLPWNRKGRSSSKNVLKEQEFKDSSLQRATSKACLKNLYNSKSSLLNFESGTQENEIFDQDDRTLLCRIVFPDGSTTVAQLNNETVESFLSRHLEKRGIHFNYFEVFDNFMASKVMYYNLFAKLT